MDTVLQVSRIGAYAIVCNESTMLFTLKKSGPYKGLWDLPGGGIEFGESPEEALRRELLEEAAIKIGTIDLLEVVSAVTSYVKEDRPHTFHHIGMLYKVKNYSISPRIPEDECLWMPIFEIDCKDLTPFAKHAISMRSARPRD